MARILLSICAIIVFFLHFMMFSLVMTSSPPNITTDKHALLAMKDHITYDPSNFLSNNWSVNTFVCNWFGVTCGSHHRRVTALNISNMDLIGTVPSQLGNLSFLAVLDIKNNKFYGSLPDELAQLRRLKYISLSFNNFNTKIPSWFGSLFKLQKLRLRNNSFVGNILPSLGNISSLQSLSLGYNQLSGTIPKEIGKFTKLKELYLGYNQLQGIIPKEIGNLTKLEVLYLNNNNLQGEIPYELGNLCNMEQLALGSNNLIGSIPAAIFNISTVKNLSLQDNGLSGSLPANLNFKLSNLEQLQLGGNNIGGTFPTFITNASKLSILELQNNSFRGFIPNTIGNLRNLKKLILYGNHLTSFAPDLSFISSLANCKNLEVILLGYNPFNCVLPSFIGNLSVSLTHFYAEDCNISGRIPQEIGHLKNLLSLQLSQNQLSGPIPVTIGGLHNLQGLHLGENKLEGSIAGELCRLDRLFLLRLEDNKFSGHIPGCLGDLKSLRYLYIGSNLLNSTIPSNLWDLRDILVLNLSSNSLSGPIPLEIGSLEAAISIDLSRNQFLGNIPSTIGGLDNVQKLSFEYNRLQGPIPRSIGGMTALVVLDLSNNNLSGDIPISMEMLKSLYLLNLSFNKLKGEIPKGGAFTNLSSESFIGNLALCGLPKQGVPPCKAVSHRKSMITYILLATFLPLAVGILTLILILIRFKGRSKTLPQDDEMPQLATWRRFSYRDLLQATNRFSDSNLLGSGSFGSVYDGTLQDGTKIAVKVFHPQFEGAVESFDVECKVMGSIRHRNLVQIISSCSDDDHKALVLKYMSNGSLDKWLFSQNHFLDILQRLDIMMGVSSALEYLHFHHTTPIVHCDLKPNNVLLDEDMVAHLSDFGIAKLLGDEESTRQTQILATIGYMAPEYGSEGKVSRKCDVYSYGIMLIETFTRKKPTDESFTEEMSLKQWVSDSLRDSILKVVDVNLLRREDEHFDAKEECVSSVLSLAIDCTHELPGRRIDMRKVVNRLTKIKVTLLAKLRRGRER